MQNTIPSVSISSVIMRVRDPKATVLIFATGKMVCTGAKSERLSELAARKLVCPKHPEDGYVSESSLGISRFRTLLQTVMLNSRSDRLGGLALANPGVSSYEPEVFPGLRYRMIEPKITLLIFVSGKVVITGEKCREDVDKAFELIYVPQPLQILGKYSSN